MNGKPIKGLVIILDGLGDRPNEILSGLTPLEYADTPVMDKISELGQSGLMDPLLPGLPVDTHTGVGILFGLSPEEATYLCRGPIEAAGIDLDLQVGDLLFRTNLATVERQKETQTSNFKIVDRRAGRISENVDTLCESLQNIDVGHGIVASLYPATQHRCVLRLRGALLSASITDTDPGGKSIESGVLRCYPHAISETNSANTAAAINTFTEISHEILNVHPINLQRAASGELLANGVITRGGGAFQELNNIHNYLNTSVAAVAGESTIIGLGKLFNFTTITDPDFTSMPDTNIDKKLNLAIQALKTHDLVYVHLKGTDTAAHDRDPLGKANFISRFDTALGEIDTRELVVGICADHSTDSFRGEHNGDPVPVTLANPRGRKDLVKKFNETDCSIGSLGRITAQGFLISVLDAMGCLSNYKPSEMALYRLSR